MLNDPIFPINLMDGGDVITRDGEFLGTWTTDETDALYCFIPDGETEPVLTDPFVGSLCTRISAWHEDRGATE